MPYSGEVVFQKVFDLGGTIDFKKARTALGAMVVPEVIETLRARPEYVSLASPLVLDVASLLQGVEAEDGTPVTISARLYESGALATMVRFRVSEEKLSALARCQQLRLKTKGEPRKRSEIVTQAAESVRTRLEGVYEDVFDVPVDPESFTSYCMTEVPGGAARVLRDERPGIAALLIGEPKPEKLSLQQTDEVTRHAYMYYDDDLTITDWDAAFVVEPNAVYEDLLYVFEVANMQLLLLRKYDKYLDMILERGYSDFEQLYRRPPLFFGRLREMVRDLNEVRMDMAKTTDELENIAKFFGDWYLARVYMGLAQRLHLADYEKSVDEKLVTLNDLYQSVLAETQTRQNLVLEWAIVLLIIFEVVMALWH